MTAIETKIWRWITVTARLYGVLFIMATIGFFATNVTKLVGGALASPDRYPLWLGIGWHLGTLVGLVGAAMGWIRFENGFSDNRATDAESIPSVPGEPRTTAGSEADAEPSRSPLGFRERIGNGLFLAVVLGMVGLIFGCSLLVFWFWFTAGPYAPESWLASVAVRAEKLPGDSQRSLLHTTTHPIALAMIWIPGLLGLLSGAVLGTLLPWRTTRTGNA